MGANQARPPLGNTVMVEPDKMVELLNQWMNNRIAGKVVIPIEIWFGEEQNEAVPITVIPVPVL